MGNITPRHWWKADRRMEGLLWLNRIARRRPLTHVGYVRLPHGVRLTDLHFVNEDPVRKILGPLFERMKLTDAQKQEYAEHFMEPHVLNTISKLKVDLKL